MISSLLNESLANRYVSSSAASNVKKAFEFSAIAEAMEAVPADSFSTECAVVFSDISGFSNLVKHLKPAEVKLVLDHYYKQVIPIIYKHGGLIDQMIGDGILSVYSPKLSAVANADVFEAGLKAAEEIVSTFAGHEYFSTKCALHKDAAMICQVGDENYQQATIVGNIMTIVHRVESVAKDEAVNMLLSIPEANQMNRRVTADTSRRRLQGVKSQIAWELETFTANLKGVGVAAEILFERYVGPRKPSK